MDLDAQIESPDILRDFSIPTPFRLPVSICISLPYFTDIDAKNVKSQGEICEMPRLSKKPGTR
jgi:hypothetical protein